MPKFRLFAASTPKKHKHSGKLTGRCHNTRLVLFSPARPASAHSALFALILCLLLPLNMQAQENLEAAAQTVDRLHGALITAMKQSGKSNFDKRLHTLQPVVEDSFEFETVSKAVLGRHWRQLDDRQKSEFINVFKSLSASTYAKQFSSHDGENFSKAQASAYRDADAKVKAELIRSSEENVKFTYLLRNFDGQWRIVNVIAQGVSDIALKRADYSSVIKAEGFTALLEKIRAQASH